MEFIVSSVENTMRLGYEIGKRVKSGDILCLTGDLGAGKTHFTKGVAKGLSIEEDITSPTFTIVNEYDTGRLKLYHFDVYRVNDPYEIEAIGFDEYIFGDGVSIIEWSNYIQDLIPNEALNIDIKKLNEFGENYRKVLINYNCERYNYMEEISL
jgi:tRNA threonylcarbamoyladenosine biosynthesis protein TsaE